MPRSRSLPAHDAAVVRSDSRLVLYEPNPRSSKSAPPAPRPDTVAPLLVVIRGERVMLSDDLAALYGVPTRALTQAYRRNLDRFPPDFAFQLTREEGQALQALRSQAVTLKRGQHIKHLPFAFTEQGVAMLSSVLRSPRAVEVNIAIMRTFVQLRRLMDTNRDLAARIDALEARYDEQFAQVFDAIRQLIAAGDEDAERATRRIGFTS